MTPLTPGTVSLESGQTAQFSVTASGESNTAIIWSFLDASGNPHYSGDSQVGTVTASGLYTAPTVNTATTVTILASAAADTSIQRSAIISLAPIPPPVAIAISPTSASVQTCSTTPCGTTSTVKFTAQVTNTNNTSVGWEVNGQEGGNSAVGSISSAGIYVAPAAVPSPATVTVIAVANADPTKTASATVTVTQAPPPVTINLNNTNVTLTAGQSFGFAATDNQGNPLSASYTVTCSASNCGSFTPAGTGDATYTAPSTLPNNTSLLVTVTAAATADPSAQAIAMVTVNPLQPPSLEIDFNSNSILMPSQTLILTAKVNNLPNGTSAVFDWTQSSSTFCVSSDEEAVPFQDNCGDSDGDPVPETDGPGQVTPASNGSAEATYQASQVIWNSSNGGIFYPNACSQATAQNTYVYITVSTVINSITLNASACVHLTP